LINLLNIIIISFLGYVPVEQNESRGVIPCQTQSSTDIPSSPTENHYRPFDGKSYSLEDSHSSQQTDNDKSDIKDNIDIKEKKSFDKQDVNKVPKVPNTADKGYNPNKINLKFNILNEESVDVKTDDKTNEEVEKKNKEGYSEV